MNESSNLQTVGGDPQSQSVVNQVQQLISVSPAPPSRPAGGNLARIISRMLSLKSVNTTPNIVLLFSSSGSSLIRTTKHFMIFLHTSDDGARDIMEAVGQECVTNG